MMTEVLLVGACFGLVTSSVYLILAAVAARRFRRRAARLPPVVSEGGWPSVSVLKPLHGAEQELESCLESFFRQRYPAFELVFGARTEDDPAWEIVDRLRQRYPRVSTRAVYSGEPRYPNAKVSTLTAMIDTAAFPYVVIADSDTRIAPDCLLDVCRPLLDPHVGLVTCPYRGVSAGSFYSSLEALGMSVEMTSGVLVAEMLEGMRFALGPTMATRTDVLAEVGGLEALGEYCADDYVLGQRVHAAGKSVVLSHHVIEHVAVNRSLTASLQHQVRWMRSSRFSRPWGHIGTVLTFAMPFGLLGLAAAAAAGRPVLALALIGWAIANRIVLSLAVGWGVVRDRDALARCWLYPLRDLIGFGLWACSLTGTRIMWRGEEYELGAEGKMCRVSASDHRSAAHRPPRAGSETAS